MTKTEIKSKMQVGDYKTLGKILGCETEAARKRFKRDNPEAISAMEQIVMSRENLLPENK